MLDRTSTPPRVSLGAAITLSLALTFALAGCAAVAGLPCEAGERVAISELLYFGTAKPGGAVSDAEWDSFLQDSVSPRFGQGFSH